MPVSHGRTFVGDTQSAALAQPFVMSPSPHRQGVLIAKENWYGFPIYFDPYYAKSLGGANSMSYTISGQLDQGKTAFMKALARRLCNLQAFDDPDEPPVLARTLIHDRKMNEYADYTKVMRGTTIEMGGAIRFNPFDHYLAISEVHMVDIAVNLCEVIKKLALSGHEPTVLAIGIHLMLKSSRRPSPEHLESIMMNMTREEARSYYQSNSLLKSVKSDDSVPDTMKDRLKPLISEDNIGNISWQELQTAAGNVAGYLGQLTRGVLGAVFGGEESMYERLTNRCVNIVWRDTNIVAQDAAEAVMAKWRTIARHNPSLREMVPHQIISDEAGKALARSAIHLRFMSEDRRDARAMHTATFTATQYEGDITSAGGSDPNLANMAEAINNATAGRVIFNQPNTETNVKALKQYGFEDIDVERVTILPKGYAAFKMPNQPPVFGRILLTAADLTTTYSNQQADKMVVGRRPALSDSEILRRAKLLGVSEDIIAKHSAPEPEEV